MNAIANAVQVGAILPGSAKGKDKVKAPAKGAAKSGTGKGKRIVVEQFDVTVYAKNLADKLLTAAEQASRTGLECMADAVNRLTGEQHKPFLDAFEAVLPEKSRRVRKSEFKVALDASTAAGRKIVCDILADATWQEAIPALRAVRDAYKANAEKANDAIVDKELTIAELTEELSKVTKEEKGDEKETSRIIPMKDEVLAVWLEKNLSRLNYGQCKALIEAITARANAIMPDADKKKDDEQPAQ